MAENTLTPKERYKFTVLKQTLDGEITNGHAGKLLSLSVRQIRRLKRMVEKNGNDAIVHRLKGKASNHQVHESLKEQVLLRVAQVYSDFKPAFAAEKLMENDHLIVNPQTLRRWMIAEGLWKQRRKKKADYHAWRPRKEYFGELQQFDGSYHNWFEDRYCDKSGNPIETCLLAAIDDATGKITYARFSAHEGVVPVFLFWRIYVHTLGKPLAIYLDKFSTYKINYKSAVDNPELMTQFQRATKNLEIELICANSPQAKGRIERLFGTLQDRLVKEMRLGAINTPKQGNRFLKEIFIPKFNSQFAVIAEKDGDVHRPLTKSDKHDVNRTFAVQSTRTVHNDFTIQFENVWYQLLELQPTTIRPKETILTEKWLNGTIHFSFRGQYLNYSVLPEKPKKQQTNPAIITRHKLMWKPGPNHPWRKPLKGYS